MVNFLSIPLPDNTQTGWSCGEVCFISALLYLNVAQPSNEERARELTKKVPGYNTWPEQLVRIASAYPEIQATIYRSRELISPVENYICSIYSPLSADLLVKETDLEDFEQAREEVSLAYNGVVQDVSLESILAEVKEGRVVIVWVDYETLHARFTDRGFNAHYVIVTGFDESNIYVHECGGNHSQPEANKSILRERFVSALGPDPNYIVVSAKE